MADANFRKQIFGIVADGALSKEEKAARLKALVQPDATATMKQMRNMDAILGQSQRDAATIAGTQIMAPMGGVADTHLRPDLAPKVPAGAARPYAPGEFTTNPDGSWSSERSMTVKNKDGSWSVIPSVYLKDGRPYEAAGEGEAQKLAAASKLPFRKFNDLKTADQFSIDREADWQPIENPADASSIAPLWEKAPAAAAAPGIARPAVAGAAPLPTAAPPTAAFPGAPTQPDPFALASEIEKRKQLALAAFARPTIYPTPTVPNV